MFDNSGVKAFHSFWQPRAVVEWILTGEACSWLDGWPGCAPSYRAAAAAAIILLRQNIMAPFNVNLQKVLRGCNDNKNLNRRE